MLTTLLFRPPIFMITYYIHTSNTLSTNIYIYLYITVDKENVRIFHNIDATGTLVIFQKKSVFKKSFCASHIIMTTVYVNSYASPYDNNNSAIWWANFYEGVCVLWQPRNPEFSAGGGEGAIRVVLRCMYYHIVVFAYTTCVMMACLQQTLNGGAHTKRVLIVYVELNWSFNRRITNSIIITRRCSSLYESSIVYKLSIRLQFAFVSHRGWMLYDVFAFRTSLTTTIFFFIYRNAAPCRDSHVPLWVARFFSCEYKDVFINSIIRSLQQKVLGRRPQLLLPMIILSKILLMKVLCLMRCPSPRFVFLLKM